MTINTDICRCTGTGCPSRDNCERSAYPVPRGAIVTTAALYVRREPGATACDQYIPIADRSTFKEVA